MTDQEVITFTENLKQRLLGESSEDRELACAAIWSVYTQGEDEGEWPGTEHRED